LGRIELVQWVGGDPFLHDLQSPAQRRTLSPISSRVTLGIVVVDARIQPGNATTDYIYVSTMMAVIAPARPRS
jgi:hypothetical protein